MNKKLRICDLRTGTPQEFEDLQLRNQPKNLLICDLRTLKKVCLPTLDDGQGLNGVGATSISSKKAQPSFLIVVLR
jgi:hypothetical protein